MNVYMNKNYKINIGQHLKKFEIYEFFVASCCFMVNMYNKQ